MRRLFCLVLMVLALPSIAADRPNVILIITDDQGYGDVGALGNTILKTPNLDKLHSESIRLTNYHTDPTCSPTRAALMTGRYSTRSTVWHTINGRSLMAAKEFTLAELFQSNGYRTAMFGKWHLGDNAPLRPVDQGFEHVVWHKGGGIAQGPDYFGNDYFDDMYEVNGEYQQFKGYCTDVWFDNAMSFINADQKKPFFVYLATNAAHGPWNVDEKYSQPYRDQGVPNLAANFYGMIANLDENLGRLRAFLDEKGLSQDTLLIYTSDNGTAVRDAIRRDRGQFDFFNAGMRDTKGSYYEGGHRVPIFMHWPAGGISGGKDVDVLSAHFDLTPTFMDAFNLNRPGGAPSLDGVSLMPAIRGDQEACPDRTLFVATQRGFIPPKWEKSAVMTERWRLTEGKELYDILEDPGQGNDIAGDHPEVVEQLRERYESWWEDIRKHHQQAVRIDLGGAEDPTTLMSHDWLVREGIAPIIHLHVKNNWLRNGPFAVNVAKAGKYRITPMRWPESVDQPSGCTASKVEFVFGSSLEEPDSVSADLSASRPLNPDEPAGAIEVELPAGPAALKTTLTRKDGKTFGAYYVKVEYLGME